MILQVGLFLKSLIVQTLVFSLKRVLVIDIQISPKVPTKTPFFAKHCKPQDVFHDGSSFFLGAGKSSRFSSHPLHVRVDHR